VLFTPNQTLLDGYDRYEADTEYDIPEDRAAYLVSLGWGEAPDLPRDLGNWSEPATVATLEPHDLEAGSS
jgi:hypothetical protein